MKHPFLRIALLVVLIGVVAFGWTLREQELAARDSCQTAYDTLADTLDGLDSLTPEQVHEITPREPVTSRVPGEHKLVEEFRWNGPMGSYTLYAYYQTAATQLLEAVSINRRLPEWEGVHDAE